MSFNSVHEAREYVREFYAKRGQAAQELPTYEEALTVAHQEALVEDTGRDMDALNEQLRYMPWPSPDKAALKVDLEAARARYDELADEKETARERSNDERRPSVDTGSDDHYYGSGTSGHGFAF